MREWLSDLGFNLQVALAGFWGSVVYALRLSIRKASWMEIVSTLVTGTVSANYLGAVAVKYTGAPELATGFLVGLGGMVITSRLLAIVVAKMNKEEADRDAKP